MRAPAFAAALLLLAACSHRETAPEGQRPWREFVRDLVRVQDLPRLDVPGVELIGSFDPTGANDDFNHFRGPGTETGWVLLADLKGPGVVRRFWTTGEDPGHRFRFYFDGEKKPRVEGELDELFGGRPPFQAPLARNLNLCWYSYLPLTYQQSLRIEMQAPNTHPIWGPRRLYYQLSAESLPSTAIVQTFPKTLAADDQAALREVAAAWSNVVEVAPLPALTAPAAEVPSGGKLTLFSESGPGLLSAWHLHLSPGEGAWSQKDREFMLQDCVLRVAYDDLPFASIEAPVGDFFGNAWRKRQYATQLFSSAPGGFTCRMPMPYAKGLRIELVNGSDQPVRAALVAERGPAPAANMGYLHAEWRRTGPEPGQPHPVAAFRGDGKFVGTFLGVTGAPRTQEEASWWILEGDEQMYIDGATRPQWHGTGLEDYFNGGWYYKGAAFGATHGIFDRAPFRVAQFRHQMVDPVRFTNLFQMVWERGDRNVSRGYFQSVAYAYLRQPAPVAAVSADRNERRAVPNPVHVPTLMLQLVELERMNDFEGARHLLAEQLEEAPEGEHAGIWRLRDLEYRRLLGDAPGQDAYQPFVDGKHGTEAATQAKLLTWFYAATNRALLGLYASGDGTAYLDGRAVLQGDSPYTLLTAGVELTDGPHQLAGLLKWKRNDAWFQLGLRTHTGVAASGTHTKWTRQPPEGWQTVKDLSTWTNITLRESARGVPDAPLIGGTPNAFVLIQSKAYACGATDWMHYRDPACFRLDFNVPLKGWPSQAPDFSGLSR